MSKSKHQYTSFEDDPGMIWAGEPPRHAICQSCLYRKRDLSCGIMPPEYHSAVLQTNECSNYKKRGAQ